MTAKPKNKASITRTEKQVFDGIFKEIKHSGGPVTVPKHDVNEIDPNAILRLFIQESGQRPGQLVESNQHMEDGQKFRRPSASFQEIIRRYPLALRHKALQVSAREPVPPDWLESLPCQSFQPSGPAEPYTPTKRGVSKDPRHGVYRPLRSPLKTEADVVCQSGPNLRNFDAIKEDEIARGTFRGKTADYVENELKSIAAELQECVSNSPKSQSGAFKIWATCQSRIFPIIKLLDTAPTEQTQAPPTEPEGTEPPQGTPTPNIEVHKKPSKKSKKPKDSKAHISNESASTLTTLTAPTLPPGVSPILTTTTLYPTLTLLAFHLLTSSFSMTPFPLTLYTSLKSLSPPSRILGLNVHFYNAFLTHVWTSYSSLSDITFLLSEMEASGVDCDGSTYTFIRSIEEERWTQFNRGEGNKGKDWWLRPEQVRRFAEMMKWKQIIAVRLQEQGMGHLLAEREYSSDLQAMGEGVIAESPRVWL